MIRHRKRDAAMVNVSPADASLFHTVTQAIRRKGRPVGWTRARDLILDRFPDFEARWGGYQALKAALEIDRHAMFAEVQDVATEGRYKREVWDQFQAFLKGDVAQPPSMRGAAWDHEAQVDNLEGAEDDAADSEEDNG